MDGDDILFMIVAVLTIAFISFCGGLAMGVDLGMEKGSECILSGHKVTEDYLCIEVDKLRGMNDEL